MTCFDMGFIKRHWGVFVTVFFVSVVFGSNHIYSSIILQDKNEAYYPITLEANYDAATAYVSRIHAAYSGRFFVGDISLVEHRNDPAILSLLPPIIVGGLARIIGSEKAAYIISDFLFPAIIFVAVYFLFFEVSGFRFLSLFSALFFIFIPQIGAHLFPVSFNDIQQIYFNIARIFYNPDSGGIYYFSRIEYPKLTFPFYVFALYFFVRAIKRREMRSFAASGLMFGLLFYTYLYDWIFIGTAFFAVAFLLFLKKDYARVRRLFISLGIGALISIPYWLNFFELSSLQQYKDIVARVGIEVSHTPRFSAWILYIQSILAGVAVWLVLRKKDPIIVVFVWGLFIALFAVLNIQIVSGFNPQPNHWLSKQFIPGYISFLVVFVWLYHRLAQNIVRPLFLKICASAIIIFVIATQGYSQYVFATQNVELHTIKKEFIESYRWLQENTPANSVVGTISPTTNTELLLYTKNKVFLPNGNGNTTASNEEIWKRFMVLSAMHGVLPEMLAASLTPKQLSQDIHNYVMYLFHFGYQFDRSLDVFLKKEDIVLTVPQDVLYGKTEAYKTYSIKNNTDIPYRLDYLYFGPREQKEVIMAQDPGMFYEGLKKVYVAGGISIYKINR